MGMNRAVEATAVATSIALLGVPRVGSIWEGQGGKNAGLMKGENGLPDYFVISPTSKLATINRIAYGSYGKKTAGADSRFDGLANMRALLESGNDHPLAQWAASIEIEGFTDLYPPSIAELALLRVNLPDEYGNDIALSSTQYSANGAWFQDFDNGYQYIVHKGLLFRGWAVRRVIAQ
jgi:hypothetical protein